ncbi:TPA: hypothetical protein N0F65_012141 [Lagenidium giganteum]|uniref:Leucine-rich repeat domain, L domain-like n=1 Tax=Lagenidium giganteum TaxID=4803 RepID=A0AAV2YKJ6_9STRA|nr:TPA: hypothetical protein N0F65_012141 [Lagenidium giganteum]
MRVPSVQSQPLSLPPQSASENARRRHPTQIIYDITQRAFAVTLAAPRFAVAWLIVLALHGVCATVYIITASLYTRLLSTVLGTEIPAYDLAVSTSYFPAIAASYGVLASIHVLVVIELLYCAVRDRTLEFRHPGSIAKHHQLMHHVHVRLGSIVSAQTQPRPHFLKIPRSCFFKLSTLVTGIFGRHGLFGIESPHFDLVLLGRKFIQIAALSYQAYTMSYLVPRTWLNRLMTCCIVFNCWAPAILHRTLRGNLPLSRTSIVVVDVVLTFVTHIIIPILLFVPYYYEYDNVATDFALDYWYDPIWFITFIFDFRMMLVTSWVKFAIIVLLALSLINGLSLLKALLATDKETSMMLVAAVVRVAPLTSNPQASTSTAIMSQSKGRREERIRGIGQMLLVIWGFIVAVLHVSAISYQPSKRCYVHLYPWFSTEPSCSMLEMNCKRDGISGSTHDFDSVFDGIDRNSLSSVIIRHCPALHITSRILDFPSLLSFEVHNSTIVEWGADAAVNQHDHPILRSITLVNVNTTHLPEGMLSDDLPTLLTDIEICRTNLTLLPDDLDTKWPNIMYFYFEDSHLTEFPPVLTRMSMSELSLVGNVVPSLPAAMLESPVLEKLTLNGNPIAALPDVNATIGVSPVLYLLGLDSTLVSALPSWLTPAFASSVTVQMGNTPWCAGAASMQRSSFGDIGGGIVDGIDCSSLSVDKFNVFPIRTERDSYLPP